MCAICGHRPKSKNGRFCSICQAKLDKEKRQRKAEQPFKFATYQGHVIGFYRNGKGGILTPRLLKRKPEGLPKGKTLDLNHYIEGFTRQQIKNLKSAILQLASGK
jgi:hypothetical protein